MLAFADDSHCILFRVFGNRGRHLRSRREWRRMTLWANGVTMRGLEQCRPLLVTLTFLHSCKQYSVFGLSFSLFGVCTLPRHKVHVHLAILLILPTALSKPIVLMQTEAAHARNLTVFDASTADTMPAELDMVAGHGEGQGGAVGVGTGNMLGDCALCT